MPDKENKPAQLAGKYLTFKLDKEEYGIEILKVIEIIGLQKITPVPRTPDYVKGVINLRGIIHPVMDLKKRFGMTNTEYTDQTCIIVIIIEKNDTKEQVGVLVDSVSEVVDISAEEIEEVPQMGNNLNADFITGMAKDKENESVTILLNVEKILSKAEVANLSQISTPAAASKKNQSQEG